MRSTEVGETRCPSGYGKPPWLFSGSALYQLHLVKAETARAFIPKDFRLVEAFGYTLGGFFLASYDDSPAGAFDELVVIAGIVWNPPTSCACAARVLVNSAEACDHGRKDVGLPSQVARFSKRFTAVPSTSEGKFNGFLNMIGLGRKLSHEKNCMDIEVTEIDGPAATNICSIQLSTDVPQPEFNKWMGLPIKMSLPSFSGNTKYNPKLLKYCCNLECRVRVVNSAKVWRVSDSKEAGEESDNIRLSVSVMFSKPILALEFNCLKMQVEAPTVISTS